MKSCIVKPILQLFCNEDGVPMTVPIVRQEKTSGVPVIVLGAMLHAKREHAESAEVLCFVWVADEILHCEHGHGEREGFR